MNRHRYVYAFPILLLYLELFTFCAMGEEPSYLGVRLSTWIEKMGQARTQQEFARASNAVHQMGTNAVPFLLQIVRTNVPPQPLKSFSKHAEFLHLPEGSDEVSLQVALACRVLGGRAQPVFTELTNRLANGDDDAVIVAKQILLNSGAPGLWPLIEFHSAEPQALLGSSIDSVVYHVVSVYPEDFLPALIRIHEQGNPTMRAMSRRILEGAFSGDIGNSEEHVAILLPLLNSNLHGGDSFIRSQILGYLRQCGTNATAVLPEVKKLLSDIDPAVRSDATNALNAIQPQK